MRRGLYLFCNNDTCSSQGLKERAVRIRGAWHEARGVPNVRLKMWHGVGDSFVPRYASEVE